MQAKLLSKIDRLTMNLGYCTSLLESIAGMATWPTNPEVSCIIVDYLP